MWSLSDGIWHLSLVAGSVVSFWWDLTSLTSSRQCGRDCRSRGHLLNIWDNRNLFCWMSNVIKMSCQKHTLLKYDMPTVCWHDHFVKLGQVAESCWKTNWPNSCWMMNCLLFVIYVKKINFFVLSFDEVFTFISLDLSLQLNFKLHVCVCVIARETFFVWLVCIVCVQLGSDILRPQKNQFLVQGLTEWTNLNHVSVGLLFCFAQSTHKGGIFNAWIQLKSGVLLRQNN